MAITMITPIRWDADRHWNEVEQCLPEPLVDVWVCYSYLGDDEDVAQAYLKPDGRWVLTGSDPDRVIRPTHWMAQPLPPGGGRTGARCAA